MVLQLCCYQCGFEISTLASRTDIRDICCRPVGTFDSAPVHPLHSANRHDAGCGGARADRVAEPPLASLTSWAVRAKSLRHEMTRFILDRGEKHLEEAYSFARTISGLGSPRTRHYG